MSIRRFLYFAVPAICLLAIAGKPASANLLPYFVSTSAGNSGATVFNYAVSLSDDERMDGAGTGYTAFFTIYDFLGYVPGSAFAPVNWTVSVQDVGITPVGVTVPDDPTLENLTFTYIGAQTVIGTGQTFTGFGAASTYPYVGVGGFFSQQSTKNANDAGGRDYGGGPEEVPVAVPEPASMLMLGAGLMALGWKGRKLLA